MLGVVGGFLTSLSRHKQQDEEAALVKSHVDPTCYQDDIYPWKAGRDTATRLTASCVSLKATEEILPVCGPVGSGNPPPTHLISAQPLPAPPVEATQQAADFRTPQRDLQRPTCPRCGLTVPDDRPDPTSKGSSPPQSSRSPEHTSGGGGGGGGGGGTKSSKRSRSKDSVPGFPHIADAPADSCFHLLLACLWCQCSALFLGLLEACSSCLQGLCSSCCCHACGRCCSAVQEAPVEELSCHAHCHSVMFQSCCEPSECLEFCLECCQICHRS